MNHEPSGPEDGKVLLHSYSRLDEAWAEVREPRTVEELGQILIEARDAGNKVTLRGSGLSLHDQSLNDELVLSMARFDSISVEGRRVTVGAAAKWADVVAKTMDQQKVPYVVPTGKSITCGGSLASDGISRYSPSFGSESVHVESFDFLEVGQTVARTIPKPDPDDRNSDDAQLFRAVIGGFGYLGVVTSITYRLLDLAGVGDATQANQRVAVTTTLSAHEDFASLLEEQKRLLLDDVQHDLELDLEHWEIPDEPDPIRYPSVYAVAMPHGKGKGRGAVYRSVYSRGDRGKPYVIYQPEAWWRKWVTLVLSSSTFKKAINVTVWLSMKANAGHTFVNTVEDYMFFMEGQVIGKAWVEDMTKRFLPVLQQTFVVHYDKAEPFLQDIAAIVDKHDIEPTLLEFLFMPKDHILMSASHGIAGFAITLAFQDIESEPRQQRTIAAMKAISQRLHDEYEGRIHLTKNVYADPDVIRGMYGPNAERFLALKEKYDPAGVLRNDFFDRLFPR
jgi:FAD/FMN-containing dehydrogenase